MVFRINKRIRIFKGLTLNLSKSGASWSIGRPGMTVNLRKGQVTSRVGIPGTGLSYRKTVDMRTPITPARVDDQPAPRGRSGAFLFLLVLLAVLAAFLLSGAH